MKKIIILFITFMLNLNLVLASNIEVKANIPSGEYDSVIEVNLISNDKEAKIFYYTDGEGRMDNIKEFKKPILVKEDTNIDFYATTKDFEDTLIQSEKYNFNYTKNIEILEKNGKIILKNNSGDVQNIGYWQLKANNLDYEIIPNTYVQNREIYEIDYTLENNEKVTLFSPDNKVKKYFTYKKPQEEQKKQEKSTENKNIVSENSLDNNTEKNKNSDNIENELSENKNTQEIIENSQTGKEENIKNENEIILTNQIKTSVIDTNNPKQEKNNNLYYILGVLAIVILYNIGLFIKDKYKSIEK